MSGKNGKGKNPKFSKCQDERIKVVEKVSVVTTVIYVTMILEDFLAPSLC